jgi:hypothetical protein
LDTADNVAPQIGIIESSTNILGEQLDIMLDFSVGPGAVGDLLIIMPPVVVRSFEPDAITSDAIASGAIAKGDQLTGLNDLNAAGVRSAVGLNSANIDAQFASLEAQIDAIEVTVGRTGGGTLKGKVSASSCLPSEYMEIIQGEEKVITFIVEAEGRFDLASAGQVRAAIQDPAGTTIIKNDSDIERVCEQLDVQVIRVTLDAEDTQQLSSGLLKIELAFDAQKCRITQAVRVSVGILTGTGTGT